MTPLLGLGYLLTLIPPHKENSFYNVFQIGRSVLLSSQVSWAPEVLLNLQDSKISSLIFLSGIVNQLYLLLPQRRGAGSVDEALEETAAGEEGGEGGEAEESNADNLATNLIL